MVAEAYTVVGVEGSYYCSSVGSGATYTADDYAVAG